MRRPPQLGQKPRRLHENGTRRSKAQLSHRTRAKPRLSAPHVRNSRNSRSTKRGSPPPSLRSATSRKTVSKFSRTTRWRTGSSALSTTRPPASLKRSCSAGTSYPVLSKRPQARQHLAVPHAVGSGLAGNDVVEVAHGKTLHLHATAPGVRKGFDTVRRKDQVEVEGGRSWAERSASLARSRRPQRPSA